jgi:hypothetical protein
LCCSALTLLSAAATCLAQQPALPQPGPEHAALKKMEGMWDAVMSLPGGIKVKGEMTCNMECGGLWLARDLRLDLGRMSLHSKGLEGYDPATKKHISVQVDSMTTIPMILEGAYDEAAKTLTQTGTARDFNGAPEQVKSVTEHVDDDHTTVEVYRVYPDGKETKMITFEYARRKEAK